MKWTAIIVLVGLTTPLAAQQSAPAAQERQLTFTLSASELGKIGTALEARPYGEVAQLMQKLQQQFMGQQTGATPAPAPTPEPAK